MCGHIGREREGGRAAVRDAEEDPHTAGERLTDWQAGGRQAAGGHGWVDGGLTRPDDAGVAADVYHVSAPTHVDPSVDVALRSNLEVDVASGGIAVNQQLEAVSNVFVAGGVASYYDAALGRRRVEMFDHSINSGEARREGGQAMSRRREGSMGSQQA